MLNKFFIAITEGKEINYLSVVFFTFGFSLLFAKITISLRPSLIKITNSELYHALIRWLLFISILVYFCAFSILSIVKFNAYNMAMVDLGRMDQAIWNTLHGRFLFCTLEFGNACRLIMHSEFIYLLISPLYLLFSSPKTLLILQSLILSLGAVPIFWLSREKLKSYFAAICFSCAYLLYPAIQYGNLLDFHPDMLVTTFLLFSFYYLEKEKWKKYFIFLLLSLMCKEYISLIAVMFGIYILLKKKNKKAGIITFLLGVFWFFLTYKIIPAFLNYGKESTTVDFYAPLGKSISEIIRNIILHPVITFSKVISEYKIATLILLLLPVGFLCLLDAFSLLISLPMLVGLILSPFFSYTNHHNGVIAPFIFIAAINGGQYLIRKFGQRPNNLRQAIGVFVFSGSLLSNLFYGPSPFSLRFWDSRSYRYFDNLHNFKVTGHDRIADKIIAMVPAGARVSASNHLASHLSQRETIYHFPYPGDFRKVDFVLVDFLEYFPFYWIPRQQEIDNLKKLALDDDFTLRFCEDGILLFEKSGSKKEGFYFKASKLKEARPKIKLNAYFNNRLLLLGYDLEDRYFEAGKRYRIVYYWKVLKDFNKDFLYKYFGITENLNREFILIDTFQNEKRQFRLVHLPTYLLYTPKEWHVADIIREEFEFIVPDNIEAGVYRWKIGLYTAPNFYFIQTSPEHLVPETQELYLGAKEFK